MEFMVALALVAAALLHASWHAMVKSTEDQIIALSGMSVVSAVTTLVLLPYAIELPNAAFLIITFSIVLHFGYKVALAKLYRHSDLSQAYPMARGLTPLMAMALAFLLMGDAPSPVAISGIALVCAGLVLLAFDGQGDGISLLAFGVALVAGMSAAGYSVLDAYGVRLTGDAFSFTVWLVFMDSCVFIAYAIAMRGRQVLRVLTEGWARALITGWLGLISFGVFMWALGRAPVAAVSALRETSVLFSAIIAAVFLRERASWMRYAAALAVTVGAVIVATGK